MPGDGYQKELLKQLRSLRPVPGAPDAARLAGLHRLVTQLGGGSIPATFRRLMQFADEYGSEEGSDIHAYFFTIGLGVGEAGENLEQRLKLYASNYHVVEMTALRRSNRGAVALSRLVRDKAIDQRPEAMIWLTQDGATVQFTVTFYVVHGTIVHEPGFYVDGRRQDLPDLDWAPWAEDPDLFRARRRLTVELDDSALKREELVTFHIWWIAELLPIFELRTTIADARLMPGLRVSYDHRASADLSWQHHEDKCSPSEFAKSSYQFEQREGTSEVISR